MIASIFSTLCSLKVFSSGQRNARCIEVPGGSGGPLLLAATLSLTERGRSSLAFKRIKVLARTVLYKERT